MNSLGEKCDTILGEKCSPTSTFKIEISMVVHAYNPSYSEGRNWEDCNLMSAWTKS
jgi:hypothetical protein